MCVDFVLLIPCLYYSQYTGPLLYDSVALCWRSKKTVAVQYHFSRNICMFESSLDSIMNTRHNVYNWLRYIHYIWQVLLLQTFFESVMVGCLTTYFQAWQVLVAFGIVMVIALIMCGLGFQQRVRHLNIYRELMLSISVVMYLTPP